MVDKKCANPECLKMVDDKHKFCSPECHQRFRQLRGIPEKIDGLGSDIQVEKCLEYMGINKASYGKPHAYNNWVMMVSFIRDNSGERWMERVKPRLRTIMGMQHRYLDEYIESLSAWEVIKFNNGCIIYVGCPD